MTIDVTGTGAAFLAGRALFAAVLGYLALGNLRALSGTIAYARNKGAPAPQLLVPLASLALVAGAVAILIGAYPMLGALAIIGFLAGVTPIMHDFWNADGTERANERIHFAKNVGLLGGAIAFLALSNTSWPYALDLGLW